MSTTNPYAPPRADVRDMGGESGAAAGRGVRFGGAILDGIIFMAMVELPAFIGGAMSGGLDPATAASTEPGLSLGIGAVFTLIGLAVWIWLTVKYVSQNGQSIAKKILGIKVVRTDGSHASLGRIFWLRNVVNGLLSIIPLYGLVDALFIFSENRQCVHDKIADTIVVKA
jgi:uncharacterized RDD family membrane protein YckC